jgi:hypothetical protein
MTAFASEHRLRKGGYNPSVRLMSRIVDYQFSPRTSTKVRTGARIRSANITRPLIQVTVDEEWLHIGRFINTWIAREEVTSVVNVRGLVSSGFRFASADGVYDGIVIWSDESLKKALVAYRWPIQG